jgi:hypothetical protein
LYEQLRAIARERMAMERRDHTLQATALVHEAYVKLIGAGDLPWSGRAGFFHAASEAMRRVLIDHARRRNAQKRDRSKVRPDDPRRRGPGGRSRIRRRSWRSTRRFRAWSKHTRRLQPWFDCVSSPG